jgi:hypothetical protein
LAPTTTAAACSRATSASCANSAGVSCENSRVNGSAQNTSTPSSSTSSARRTRVVSTGGCEPGRTTSDGCGTNVRNMLGMPSEAAVSTARPMIAA